MIKLTFYGWEIGMRGIPFAKMLKEKTHLGLAEAWHLKEGVKDGKTFELTFEDENLANEVYDKSHEYKVLVKKEVL